MPSNHNKSNFKNHKLLHFQRTDFGHFNSYSFKFNSGIRKPIVNR